MALSSILCLIIQQRTPTSGGLLQGSGTDLKIGQIGLKSALVSVDLKRGISMPLYCMKAMARPFLITW